MRIAMFGAGVIGTAVRDALTERGHEVIVTSRSNGRHPVDATDLAQVARFLEKAGPFAAVVAALGEVHLAALAETTPQAFRAGLESKLMAQVTVTLAAQAALEDAGSITLTSGILTDPIRFGSNPAAVNAAVEGFVRGAAVDLSRGLRINAVSPGVVQESWDAVGRFVPGYVPVPGARVAQAYVRSVEGAQTGRVYDVWT